MFAQTELEKFIELQAQDKQIARVLLRLAEIPKDIAVLEKEFKARAEVFEGKKARYKKLLLTRKELEGELTAAEKLLEKHQYEQNLVKSNEAFKALASEIELQKTKKDGIETRILEYLDSIDAEAKVQEPIRLDHEEDTELTKKAIAALKAEAEKLARLLDGLKMARELFSRTIADAALLEKYNHILLRRDGVALALAKRKPGGMVCSQCNMTLLPHQINELQSGEKPVFCESCSRILYALREKPE